MTRFDSNKHHRRSIRLPDYNYASEGAYFVTICAFRKQHIFGELSDDNVLLNEFGEIVNEEWIKTPQIRPEVALDSFVIMPNHFHAILWILKTNDDKRGAQPCAPTDESAGLARPARSLGAIIAGFKSSVTIRINSIRETLGSPVWQRNYYEHIIRNEQSLNKLRQYILSNPARWVEDEYYQKPR